MPKWLEEVFLGYGDPSGAHYKNLYPRPPELDFRDTFVNWTHLVESFPGKVIKPPPGANQSIPPPYVLSSSPVTQMEPPEVKVTKKRRKETTHAPAADDTVEVRTYKLPNMGPYPVDRPRQNQIKFTPAQG